MIVTVTGANGFIGRHLLEDQLAQGRQVRAVDISLSNLEGLRNNPSVALIQADIRDTDRMKAAVEGSEIIFHLASAHLAVSLSEDEYWKINRDGCRAFVELCHRSGVSRFVHCSSVGVHGEIENPPANEDSPCHPDLIYEKTKLAGEEGVLGYYKETQFPIVVVRPVWVYGPRCSRTEKLLRMVKKGRFFFVGDGQTLRHCIYISDMVAAFNLCAEHPSAPGQVFIIGDQSAVTIRELINRIAEAVGVAPPKLALPLGLMKIACAFFEKVFSILGKEPPVSSRSLKFFTNNTSFDISRVQKEIGYQPKVSLREGLALTDASMKKRI